MGDKFTREALCRAWLQNAQGLSWNAQEALLTYFGSAEVVFDLLRLREKRRIVHWLV